MTKREFVRQYQAAAGDAVSSQAQAAHQVECMFDILAKAIHETGTYRMPGFGTWELRQRPARQGRDPRTGSPIKIKARKAILFKPSQALRERIQTKPRKARAS